MKKILLSVCVILFFNLIAIAQKASDVLENGIAIKPGNRLILKYVLKDKALEFDAVKEYKAADFAPLKDSMIFLIRKTGVNIYLLPLNPLNYNSKTEYKTITDPINQAAATALGSILDVLVSISKQSKMLEDSTKAVNPCENFKKIDSNLISIYNILQNDQKIPIAEVFKDLRNLSFEDEDSTSKDLKRIFESKVPIERHYEVLDSLLQETGNKIKEFSKCSKAGTFMIQYTFNNILKDFTTTANEQKKRLTILQSAFSIVQEAKVTASKGGGTPDLPWCTKLEFVPANEGKISLCTITINESGYNLSEKGEIVTTIPKAVIKRTIRIRKYQLFVPEVSVGTAYTTFRYNTYGTTTDEGGQQLIASPVENTIRNLKFTSMINFNLYIPNSPLHPLWQIGVGINSEAPTLLTGIGLRININGLKRLAITGGAAMTWIKELDKLKVGDKVSGTDDINKDLKYQFSWPPKPYIGIQYNF